MRAKPTPRCSKNRTFPADQEPHSLPFACSEPEAGAIHASTLATLHHLRPSQSFLLCDAGGGTVDTAVYKLMGQLSELEIAEMCVRSGANTGSLFVDLKFEELLRRM